MRGCTALTMLLLVLLSMKNAVVLSTVLLWTLNNFYSYGGRKFEHALKHGLRNGLSVVTLGWFVDSVRRKGKILQLL